MTTRTTITTPRPPWRLPGEQSPNLVHPGDHLDNTHQTCPPWRQPGQQSPNIVHPVNYLDNNEQTLSTLATIWIAITQPCLPWRPAGQHSPNVVHPDNHLDNNPQTLSTLAKTYTTISFSGWVIQRQRHFTYLCVLSFGRRGALVSGLCGMLTECLRSALIV